MAGPQRDTALRTLATADPEKIQLMRDTMERINLAHEQHAKPVHNMMPADVPSGTLPDEERLKRQRAAIASVLHESGIAGSKHSRTVVEFGAGDGELSRALFKHGIGAHFVLIDKSRSRLERHKDKDGFAPVHLCADVGSLRPEELRYAAATGYGKDRPCVAVSNHMCGAALDQAVCCALDTWNQQQQGGGEESKSSSSSSSGTDA